MIRRIELSIYQKGMQIDIIGLQMFCSTHKSASPNIVLPQRMHPTDNVIVQFEVITAMVMKSSVFWFIMPCGPFEVIRRFGATCCYYVQVEE
jgi:hypothetical protein